jgi:hypothetical protein
MKIIGVFGQLGNGKDEVANHLVTILNNFNIDQQKWRRLGFADAVKHVFMQSFNVTWEWIEEWKRKDEVPPGFDLNVRKGLQHIGDGFRKIQSDVWIRTALRNGDYKIISDGRYINEAKMIKEQGGFNIVLWRPGYENNDPNPSESQIKPYIDYFAKTYKEGPISDLPMIDPPFDGLQYFDYFLINNGTLEDLYSKINDGLVHYLQEWV